MKPLKQFFFARIPSICICFTGIILGGLVANLLSGWPVSPFPFQVLGWIVVCQGIDWLLSHLDFKSWLRYCLVEGAIFYAVSLPVALAFHWTTGTAQSIVAYSLIFLAVYLLLIWYFRRRQQLLARELNQLLQEQQKGPGMEV